MMHAYDRLSGGDLLVGGFAAFVLLGALGALSNAILRESGFGTMVNGGLLLLGTVAGAVVRYKTLGF